MGRTLALMLALTVSGEAAPVPKELKKPTDAERLQGVWEFGGYDNGGPQNTGGRWIFDGGRLCIGGSNATWNKGTLFDFAMRPKASRSEIDFEDGRRNLSRGIYEILGEELHVAYVNDADRPRDFSSAHGKFIMTMKRVPEAKKSSCARYRS